MQATPQSVSAILRREGFTPVPTAREGLHVKRGALGAVTVIADWDSPRKSREQSDEAERVLSGRGFNLHRVSENIFRTE